MRQYFLSASDFPVLIRKLLEGSKVIAPVETRKKLYMENITEDNIKDINLYGFRTVDTFKSFFFKLGEKVSSYFGKDADPKGQKLSIVGARGCDLEGLEVLDKVFTEGDFTDPFYAEARKNIFIIGADCTDCGKTCFCTLVKGKPWPLKLFDINLSPITGGYVVETGTDKGKKFIDDNPRLFLEAYSEQLDKKEKNRKKVTSLLKDVNKNYQLRLDISMTHKLNISNKIWKILTKDCVECSACNFACPTCTCFILLDQSKGKDNERFKVWDACLKAGYQKVAGGANPRGKLFERLQNRYQCKFDYSFDRLNRYTCVGCGRCIDGCAGNIDMRKIFVDLEKQAPLTAKLVE